MSSLGNPQSAIRNPQSENPQSEQSTIAARVFVALFCLGIVAGLGWAVMSLPEESAGLATRVQADLKNSGVKNPVTAVLLNFRGYDTLLEIAVLVLAVLGVWSLRVAQLPLRPDETFAGPVLMSLVRLLVPLMVVVAGYLLWLGADAPGGAFQAGAVLGAAWVLLILSDRHLPMKFRGWRLRLVLVFGFAVFLSVAGGVIFAEGKLLQYPRNWTKTLLLIIESALMVSISFILAALLVGRPATQTESEARE
jgi:multisubunit Na+/H+ antiporter MnhB subunit